MYSFSNWRYTKVTSQTTTDAGYATVILTSGLKPRAITQLACWNGTSTAAVNMRYYIYPATSVTQDANGQIQIADDLSFPIGFANADLAAAANEEQNPIVMVPMAAKGAWGNGPVILPENCLLVAAPYGGNQNGTVIHKCISAECS